MLSPGSVALSECMSVSDPVVNTVGANLMVQPFTLADLEYELPPDGIAQVPVERRDDSRLLLVDRANETLIDARFADLPDFLRSGDCLVINDTRVVPARFWVRRHSGGRLEGLFVREVELGRWEVMLRSAGRLRRGELLTFDPPDAVGIIARESLGGGYWLFELSPAQATNEVLERVGRTPLPPYIRRERGHDIADSMDAERYQTVYARAAGSVAAPTAGLHLTADVFARLEARGVDVARLTLHVGPGTFAPIQVDRLEDHRMHAEWFELSEEAAMCIDRARSAGGRVVAVGTTSTRVLESRSDDAGRVRAGSDWTDIFIYPPYRFRAVDALVTNFHLPRSTLLALVMAFGGVERIRKAYAHAIEAGYRFYSYGDAMLIV